MKNLILFFVLSILTKVAFGGSPIIFKGKVGYMLASDGIQYNSDVKILSGSLDPSVTAVDASLGSTYISTTTGGLYQKADAGSSTNWFPLLIGSAGTGTDNCVARWDGTGTTSIQDALLCVDDLGVATGLTQLLIDNLDINGNTISSTDVNGAINLAPNGTGVVNISGLTASRPMKLDASSNVTSGLIDLADVTNDITGVLPIANGGTNSNTALTSDLMMRSNGTNVIESSVGLSATGVITSVSIDGDNNTITNVPLANVVFDTTQEINGPVTDVNTMSKIYDHIGSSGIMSGCGITDNGDGTIDIATGTASLKPTADPHGQFVHINISAQAGITLTDSSTNYVYIDYNAGTPQFAVSTSIESFNCIDKCLAYVIAREGTDLSIVDALEQNVDGNRKTRRWMLHTKTFYHQEGGTSLAEIGTRNLDVTSGRFYFMMNQINHAAFDTSVADTFMYHYKNAGGWTATSSATQIDNLQYNDLGVGLATLANNKYKTDWIYLELGNTPTLHVVYSQDEYATLADAEIAGVPVDVPTKIAGTSEIIGKIIYKKSGTSAEIVASVFETVFTSSVATTHNNLSGLQGGAASEYYHFDATEFGFLDGQDQSVLTTSSPTFSAATLSGLTAKSVLFTGTGGLISEDTTNFVWDDTNNRLGVGTNSPARVLDVNGSSIFNGVSTFIGELQGDYLFMSSTSNFSIPYPRMTQAQINSAASSSAGGAYNTDTGRLVLNDGTNDNVVAYTSDGSNLNLIEDHSFETGVSQGTCTACTASSEITIVELTALNTKSLKMAFTASLGDYEDTTVTSSQYTGVVGLVSARIKTDQEDVWLCSIVDSAESHCVEVNSDGVWDVYKINSIMSSTNFGYKIKASTAITGSVYVDEVFAGSSEIETVTTQGQSESYRARTYAGYSTNNTAVPYFSTVDKNTISNLGIVTNTSADGFYFEALKKVIFNGTATGARAGATSYQNAWTLNTSVADLDTAVLALSDSSVIIGGAIHEGSGDTTNARASAHVEMSIGDKIYLHTDKQAASTAVYYGVSFTVTPQQNKAVIVSVDDDSMTDWVSYTPTISAGLGTATGVAGKWRKNGDSMDVRIHFTTGTVAASLASVSIPATYAIDANKLTQNNSSAGNGDILGYGTTNVAATSRNFVVISAPVTDNTLLYFGTIEGIATGHLLPSLGNNGFSNTSVIHLSAKFPIVGWSSRATALAAVPVLDGTEYSEENILSADTSASADVGGLTFTGLTVGKEYFLSGQAWMDSFSATNNQVKFWSGASATGTQYGSIDLDNPNASAIDKSTGVSLHFTAVSTSMYVNKSGANALKGDGSKNETFLQLRDVPEKKAFLGNVDLKEYVSTPSASKPVLVSALVTDGAATTAVTEDDSAFINGDCTNPSLGVYVCTFETGYFSSKPHCWYQMVSGNRTPFVTALSSSSISWEMRASTDFSLQDGTFYMFCKGSKL